MCFNFEKNHATHNWWVFLPPTYPKKKRRLKVGPPVHWAARIWPSGDPPGSQWEKHRQMVDVQVLPVFYPYLMTKKWVTIIGNHEMNKSIMPNIWQMPPTFFHHDCRPHVSMRGICPTWIPCGPDVQTVSIISTYLNCIKGISWNFHEMTSKHGAKKDSKHQQASGFSLATRPPRWHLLLKELGMRCEIIEQHGLSWYQNSS